MNLFLYHPLKLRSKSVKLQNNGEVIKFAGPNAPGAQADILQPQKVHPFYFRGREQNVKPPLER